MDITLATFTRWPEHLDPPGMHFTNAWTPSPTYSEARNSTLTGQYPQRKATTRITDVFTDAGWHVTEGTDAPDEPQNVFRLWEEPGDLTLPRPDGILAVATLGQPADSAEPTPLAIFWPGVAESGESRELVSPMDLAPTLAAIAGLDVRPNAQLSFDGMNLVPVLRYGASAHAALFFPNGIRMQDASLIDGVASDTSRRAALQDEWDTWHTFVQMGPLQ